MRKKKIYIIFLLSIIVLSIVIGSQFLRNKDIMHYVEQDVNGLFYETGQIQLFDNKQTDFYTTLFTNRLKRYVSGQIANAKMRTINGYNLNNFTCIKQLVDNEYEFYDEEVHTIEVYLQSLQAENNYYMIEMEQVEENQKEENTTFFTYEALAIADQLNISLHGMEEIKKYIDKLSIQDKSCKETMAILGLRELLEMDKYPKDDVQEVYNQLFENWYGSDSSQIGWYFDLYYLSYIANIGQITNNHLTGSFKNDMIELIKNPNVNITMKSMAVDIINNFGLLDNNVIETLKDVTNQIDEQCYIDNDQYAMLSPMQGNIATTYYVYLYNKLTNAKSENHTLMNSLKGIIRNEQYKEYGFQELSQLLYLSNYLGCIDSNSHKAVVTYLKDSLYQAASVNDVYFILQSIEWIDVNGITLSDKQKSVINGLIQQTFNDKQNSSSEIYDKMANVFFYAFLRNLLEQHDIEVTKIDYNEIIESSKSYLHQDIRLLYFYYEVNRLDNPDFKLPDDKLLKSFKRRGLYYIDKHSNRNSIYIQYLGKRLSRSQKELEFEMPII